jgi:hypothetical protein
MSQPNTPYAYLHTLFPIGGGPGAPALLRSTSATDVCWKQAKGHPVSFPDVFLTSWLENSFLAVQCVLEKLYVGVGSDQIHVLCVFYGKFCIQIMGIATFNSNSTGQGRPLVPLLRTACLLHFNGTLEARFDALFVWAVAFELFWKINNSFKKMF